MQIYACIGFAYICIYFSFSLASEAIPDQGDELSISIKSTFACYRTFISLLYAAAMIQPFGIFRVE